jgi:predicted RNase H-like HicB family nuclease
MTTKLQIREYLAAPYTTVVVRDEDGTYVAEILEFEGCFADGVTASEAIRNLNKVSKTWIAARLEAGIAIPPPQGNLEMSGRFALRMPQSLHQKAAFIAEREGVSLNSLIVSSLSATVGVFDFMDRCASKFVEHATQQARIILETKATFEFIADRPAELPSKVAAALPSGGTI